MKEKPIIFGGESVRAILDGRKTVTRRVVKLTGDGIGSIDRSTIATTGPQGSVITCPYGKPGDRLWVKEATAINMLVASCDYGNRIYLASTSVDPDFPLKKVNPRFMPKDAARITLEITSVRVERLKSISWEDAIKEGLRVDGSKSGVLDKFQARWDKINGKKHPWQSNPFVWVVEFRRLES